MQEHFRKNLYIKKIIFFLVFLFLSISISAQEHLSFKNIPIDGNITDFVAKLKEQGFTVKENFKNSVILNGPFAGYDDCTIFVLFSTSSETVWKVSATLPHRSSWLSTLSMYQDFKEEYIKKYGVPSNSYEFFLDPYKLGDGYELQAIKLEKGYYSTYWYLDLGIISIKIKALSNYTGWIMLTYEDAAGFSIKTKEKEQMISNDI
ncbi:MAG: hypothetical protein HUJ95_04680 [Bacteroidales bacterium]|nr:hypothetical protein [Bacteroidales bacterium]